MLMFANEYMVNGRGPLEDRRSLDDVDSQYAWH